MIHTYLKRSLRVGSIAIVQDRARDLSYLGWRLTPIYDPDPLSEGVEGIEDDATLLGEQGVLYVFYTYVQGGVVAYFEVYI